MALGPILVLIGAVVGLVAALQIVDRIGQARTDGYFGGPQAVAVDPEPAKPTEEDDLLAHALAGAIGVRTLNDCRSFEPHHRRGCRTFVERQRRDALEDGFPVLPPPVERPLNSPGAPSR